MDQPGPPLEADRLLTVLDRRLKTAIKKMDWDDILEILRQLYQARQIAGIGLAYVLWTTYEVWENLSGRKFESEAHKQVDFETTVFRALGYAPITTRRYRWVWNLAVEVRPSLRSEEWKRFLAHPMKNLVAMAQARREHRQFSPVELRHLIRASDNTDLRQRIGKMMEREESTMTLISYRLKVDGSLEVWRAGQVEVLGYLQPPRVDDSDLRKMGMARLVNRAGIYEEASDDQRSEKK